MDSRKTLYSHEDMEIQYDEDSERWYVLENGTEILSITSQEQEENRLQNQEMMGWARYLQEELGDSPFADAREKSLQRVIEEKTGSYTQ